MTPFRFLLPACWLALAAGAAEASPVPPQTHPGAGQTFYFVLTDRFANGNPTNDTGGLAGGPEEHGFDPTRIGYFHGGDFAGLTARLDLLRDLGVTAVWVTPPFRNKPVQSGSAAYHGYWVTDFLHVDPHLGTDEEFRAFVDAAHARGLKVFIDIIVNHTADVIHFPDYRVAYRDAATFPLRDAAGRPLAERDLAWNGLGDPARPALSAETSFAYPPQLPPAERHVKNPAWLNDVTLYHNRGNSTFRDESSLLGDFGGLDDLMTEHPRVVQGFIDVYASWIRDYGIDGYRIDTMRHVNGEFWQAFSPAIREAARATGRPAFLQFGEVANETQDVELLSEFSTALTVDATLDFGFFIGARRWVSQGGTATALRALFERDDLYTDHDGNAHASPTFLGNHDAGRFGYFLQQDNPGADAATLEDLVKLGHGLLFLARGQPVLYYGDEFGLVGRGGNDMQAREDLFPSRAPDFRDAPLLGTARTGADDKIDPAHPFYRFFAALARLRADHAALRTGAMLLRESGQPEVFAFSRVERGERIEYLVALNNARAKTLRATLATAQPAGAGFRLLFDSRTGAGGDARLVADHAGRVAVELAPFQFSVWRAEAPLAAGTAPAIALVNPAPGATLAFTAHEQDGHRITARRELRAEVTGGDGVAEVTFALRRSSRPDQLDHLGTDDAPPYRVYWSPPADLAPGEELTFVATVSDLRGHLATAQAGGIRVAPAAFPFGIAGATTPTLVRQPPARARLDGSGPVTLAVAATGTGPLHYQWLRDGAALAGATTATLAVTAPGRYAVLVRNRAGTALSHETEVTLAR
jgi:glycosidase